MDKHESEGTKKLFALSGPLVDTLKYGKVLIIDELDARLHPLLTQQLIKLFNESEKNPKCAQLVFTTQDTNLLDHQHLRRDQIWFAEKDHLGASHLYSLVEFKIDNDAPFERDYIQGRYGAIPYLGRFRQGDLEGRVMARRGKRKRPRRDGTGNYRERRSDKQEVLARFLIVCEGKKTEPNYFDGFRVPIILAEIDVKGLGITPPQLVEKALRLRRKALNRVELEEYDQVWCVFDKDDWDDDRFNDLIEEANKEGLQVAYSNQAFELWYLAPFPLCYNSPMHRK